MKNIKVRPAQGAGTFYPNSCKEITSMVEGFKIKKTQSFSAAGVILPHAGYVFSGKVAAATINKVIPKKKIIILGPNHHGLGKSFAVYDDGFWQTPAGNFKVDHQLALKLVQNSDLLDIDCLAHSREHSIEVILPLLKHFFSEFEFVPVCCQLASNETYKQIAWDIYQATRDISSDLLIVASGDMNHMEPESVTRQKDSLAIESIVALDADQLIERVNQQRISMCGVGTVSILINYCKLLKAEKVDVVMYQTSADATFDTSQVVGYLGAVIH